MMPKKKVIIIGGGFGGINAALALKKFDGHVIVLDRSNHHLFQPLLYQVATAALSPGNIGVPIREILRKQSNTLVLMGNAKEIQKEKKKVILSNEDVFDYDYLIVAVGAHHSYFGNDQWKPFAPGLKSLTDAVFIRERLLLAFEIAERCGDVEQAKKYLRFVVVGGGPTGVEMVGAIAEITHRTLFRNFRRISPEHSEIYLIEEHPRILSVYPESLSEKAKKDLEKLGVKVICGQHVTNITDKGVFVGDQFIETVNVMWAAGNQAPELLKTLDVPSDREGRAIVEKDLTVPGYPELFVIGDSAHALDKKGSPLPGLAPVAIQQGRYVAKMIQKAIPQEKRPPFHYIDKGSIATIGRSKAVGVIKRLKISGFIAFMIWSFVHIFYLISFRNRMLVMIQWLFWYLTGERHVRLIKEPVDSGELKFNINAAEIVLPHISSDSW